MSVMMVETFDAPMIDFTEDNDVPMAGSSTDHWIHQMEEDPVPVEVDMSSYEETTEYEMGEEGTNDIGEDVLVDVATLDAEEYGNHAISTIPEVDIPHANQETMNTLASPPIESEEMSQHANPVVVTANDVDTARTVEMVKTVEDLVNPSAEHEGSASNSTTQPLIDNDGSSNPEEQTTAVAESTEVLDNVDTHAVDELPSDEPAEAVETTEQSNSDAVQEDDQQPPASGVHSATPLLAQGSEQEVDNAAVEELIDNHGLVEEEEHETGFETVEAAVDSTYENPESVYTDPPPPIALSLRLNSNEGDQPEFALFVAPEQVLATDGSGAVEEPLVLLQHHPSLFYEPVTAVFEAFRREEYFTHIEELSEAEMVLGAHDLQLVISEDNIYSREVSLHDLYAMHQGIGLSGHLRLTLQSTSPRFITRYNHLRDQITRLVISEEGQEESQQSHNEATGEETAEEHVDETTDEAILPQNEGQDTDIIGQVSEQREEGEEEPEGNDTDQNATESNGDDFESQGTAGNADQEPRNEAEGDEEEEEPGPEFEDDSSRKPDEEARDSFALQDFAPEASANDALPGVESVEEDYGEEEETNLQETATADGQTEKDKYEFVSSSRRDDAENESHIPPETGIDLTIVNNSAGFEDVEDAKDDDTAGSEQGEENDQEAQLPQVINDDEVPEDIVTQRQDGVNPISASVSSSSNLSEDPDALWAVINDQEGEDSLYDDDASEYQEDGDGVIVAEGDVYEYEEEIDDVTAEEGNLEVGFNGHVESSAALSNEHSADADNTAQADVGEDSPSTKPSIVHKPSMKRSLRDTDLEDHETVSPPSSPESKRTRVT